MSTKPTPARQYLIEKLIDARQIAGYSIAQLAEKISASRSFITDIEKGRKNFTIDEYDRLIEGCRTTFAKVICGDSPEALRSRISRELFRLLLIVNDSKDEKLIEGVRSHLELAAHSVLIQPRASPQAPREGEDRTEGAATGSRANKPQLKPGRKKSA